MPVYSYLIKLYDVVATVEAGDGNDVQSIEYQGANAAIVQTRLERAYGAFGHGFNVEADTPIDLHHALMSTYGPDDVENLGEVVAYDPGIPDGAKT